MKSKGNPLIRNALNLAKEESYEAQMTISGTVIKVLLLMIIVAVSFMYSYSITATTYSSVLTVAFIIGGGVAIVTSFKPKIARFTAIIYAAVEGFALGAFANLLNQVYPGIAMQAVLITIIVTVAALIVYGLFPNLASRVQKFVFVAMLSILGIGLVSIILGFFGIQVPLYGNGSIGIGFSLFVIAIATLSLLIDFDSIVKGARAGEPKYMEWYCAFGLTVTLIWLYIQILQLLTQLNSRD
ncbi:Bax inhibitor-1/YccA family protein [uncultured Clostridium sp.]|uniref:Bax inhibitor-1/YccA family protein n=1 Tax=uncultured Clostridium sp. TaxID=59620 RepID=UPI002622EC18|nr:Bax inhibitor-1/YccA family protein [uncultured Clostridium sp.]